MSSNIAAVSSLTFSAEPNLWASCYTQFQAPRPGCFLGSRCRNPDMSFRFIEDHRDTYPVRLMCAVLEVSPAGYYA